MNPPTTNRPRKLVLGAAHSRSWLLAWNDILEAVTVNDLWRTFAWNDVMARYRRSRLGQFWITISIAVFIGSIGFFYGQILDVEVHDYLPYLTIGYVLWQFIAGIASEGVSVFVSAAKFLTQHRIPLSSFVLRCVQRNVIVFAHNAVMIVVVLLIFPPGGDKWLLVLLLPAAVLWYVSACWLAALLGLIAARYRDVAQITSNLMQIAFFLTPVIWQPDMLHGRARLLVTLNPFTHFIEIVRGPLLGHPPTMWSWLVCTSVAASGALVTFMIFARVRSRVAFWL